MDFLQLFFFQGTPWHIIVYTTHVKQIVDGKPEWRQTNQVHVTIMENAEKQESSTNIAILKASLEVFHKANPKVKTIELKSDNAG